MKLFVVFELKYLEDYIRERVVFSVRLKLFKYMFFVIICIFEVEIKFFNNNWVIDMLVEFRIIDLSRDGWEIFDII